MEELEPEVGQEEPEVESTPVADSEAEQSPESSEPEIAPEWLNEDFGSFENTQRQVPQGYQQQAQYEQRQQPQRPDKQQLLESFVNDPDGTLNRLVEQRLMEYVGPMAYQLQETRSSAQNFIRAQTQSAVQQARKAIESGYKEVLNKDEAFRTNKGVRARVENAMRGMYVEAVQAASRGDVGQLQNLSNPMVLDVALYMARKLEGYGAKPSGLYSPKGASVESTKSKTKTGSKAKIDPDLAEALRSRLGPDYLERYRQRLEEEG